MDRGLFVRPSASRSRRDSARARSKQRIAAAVESVERRLMMSATYTVTTTADSGAGSLRQAIIDANVSAGADLISFAIAGTGVQTIPVQATALPDVTDPVTIDGTTQSGYAGFPLIELAGKTGLSGLKLGAGSDGSTIKGLVINRFGGNGISVLSSNNKIQGNYIGTDPTGTVAQFESGSGVSLQQGGNLVGGLNPGDRNVISGNYIGIDIPANVTMTGGNTIVGNYIGTNAAGDAAITNTNAGISAFTPSNQIGGTVAAARNIISGNTGRGIRLSATYEGLGGTGNVVEGNYIGTNAAGTAAIPNHGSGVEISSGVGNRIGGIAPGSRNVISGNQGYSVYGWFSASGSTVLPANNVVEGNYIGVDPAGSNPLGNGLGVGFFDGVKNLVGGTVAEARNVISGNTFTGVTFGSSLPAAQDAALAAGVGGGGQILGNYIGTDATGTVAVPNSGGVIIQTPNVALGGTTQGSRNVISGNTYTGVFLGSGSAIAAGTQIQGNYIGVDATGQKALGNFAGIITAASSITIGGTSEAARNVISGNRNTGVSSGQFNGGTSTAVIVQGNSIGTDASGTIALGNAAQGIAVGANVRSVSIGGSAPAAANKIAFNTGAGVVVYGQNGSPAASGIRINANAIWENGGLGIDLAGDGPTANDSHDADAGPNQLQNSPAITAVRQTVNGVDVDVELETAGPGPYLIEFFANHFADPSGFGEGELFLGRYVASVDASGHLTQTFALPAPPAGWVVSATATDAGDSTSEFSNAVAVGGVASATPMAPDLRSQDDSGVDSTDNITLVNLPTFTGTALRTNTVGIYDDDQLLGTAPVVGDHYSFKPSIPLSDGLHHISVRYTDQLGQPQASPPLVVVIDTLAPHPTFVPVTPDPRNTQVISITINTAEPLANLDVADLTLTRNGGANLLGPAQGISPDAGGFSYTILNLGSATNSFGQYEMRFATGASLSDIAGNPAVLTSTEQFQIVPRSAEASIRAVSPDPRFDPVSSFTIDFDTSVTGFDVSDLTLTRDGGANLLTGAQTLSTTNGQTYTLANVASLTTAAGNYELRLVAANSGIENQNGASLGGDAVETFTVNAYPAPTVVIRTSHNDAYYFDAVYFQFSEAVTGFDRADLTLTRNGTLVSLANAYFAQDNDRNFELAELRSIYSTPGNYVLTLAGASSGIVGSRNNPFVTETQIPFTIQARPVPTVQLAVVTPSPATAPVDAVSIVFSEPVTGFYAVAMMLSRDGGPNLLTDAQKLTTTDNQTWKIDGLSALTKLPGTYTLTLDPTLYGITGNSGFQVETGASTSFKTAAAPANSIHGSVWNDVDADGKLDASEQFTAGWTIYIDSDKDGKLDSNEQRMISDSSGSYIFTGLKSGSTYRVREVSRSGWKQTSPSSNSYYDVKISSSTSASAFNFANTNTGSISGMVYDDLDGDGKKDSNERGQVGIPIYVDSNNDGQRDNDESFLLTDKDGKYSLRAPAGTVVVRSLVNGRITTPSAGRYSVSVSAGSSNTGRDFGVTQLCLISGIAFKDSNGNGDKDSSESWLSGWKVFIDSDNDGKLDSNEASTTVDSSGKWAFKLPGAYATYTVRLVPQSGYVPSVPAGSGAYSFNVYPSQSITGVVFAQKKQ